MVIDNSIVIVKDRKMMYLLVIGLIIILSFILFTDYFDEPMLGISREFYVIFFCFLYVAINIYRFTLNYHYINFSDEGNKIAFKYFSLRPFMQQRRTIEIPKEAFIKFELIKTLGGLKESLILYQRVNRNTAKYPPIPLTALTNQEHRDLIDTLQKIQKM